MNINDEYIKEKFFSKNGKVIKSRIDNITDEERSYIENRYEDSDSIKESLFRIFNNIDIRPVCPVCGGKLQFYGRKKKPYFNHCSMSCADIDSAKINYNERVEKYGCFINIKKAVETRKNRDQYKDENKRKRTLLERYGSENYVNVEKRKITCLEKYGVEEYLISKDCYNKRLIKLGVDNYRKTEECKQKVSKYLKEHKDELNEKRKKTCLKHFGVENPFNIPKYREYVQSEKAKQKGIETKRKNGTFNTSKPEEESYELIKEVYSDVIRQYKCDRYPFACDFYIPSIDTFIECQYGWTHGGHPYNKENKDDIELLESWKSKNKEYYNNAIDTWSIRDVNKRNIAIQNNLNYLEFWNINELKDWLKVTIN